MKNRPHSFLFHVKDFLTSRKIAVMTNEQVGAYTLLLATCWDSDDCSLPDDPKTLAALSRMGERWFTDESEPVRACFMPHPKLEGHLTNERLYAEHKFLQKTWRERSKAGQLGGIKSGLSRRQSKQKRSEAEAKQSFDFASSKTEAKGSNLNPNPNPNLNDNDNDKERGSETHAQGAEFSLNGTSGTDAPMISPEALAEKWNAIPGVKPITFTDKLPATIRTAARARIKQHNDAAFWDAFFQRIGASAFLTGKSRSKESEPFQATFDWAMGPINFDKIISGKYDGKPQPHKGGIYHGLNDKDFTADAW